MSKSTIEVVNKLDEIAHSRGCEIEQIAVSLNKTEAAVIFKHNGRDVYSVHSYFWFTGEPLRNFTDHGSYDCDLATARRVLTRKARYFMGAPE